MSEIATAKINSFAPIAAQTDFPVSPSEESVFVLTSSQLQEIIRQATAPIRQELQVLRASQEADIERLALDIALDRQRLARLEKIEPQPLQKDRGKILQALLAAMHGDIEVKPYHLSKRQNVLVLK
jgi:hypothetical protein